MKLHLRCLNANYLVRASLIKLNDIINNTEHISIKSFFQAFIPYAYKKKEILI
jgi:hypothetical protein